MNLQNDHLNYLFLFRKAKTNISSATGNVKIFTSLLHKPMNSCDPMPHPEHVLKYKNIPLSNNTFTPVEQMPF
jgi:hypothetical protein